MARELWIKQFNMVCVKSGEVVMQESQMLNLEHAADELGVPVVGVDDDDAVGVGDDVESSGNDAVVGVGNSVGGGDDDVEGGAVQWPPSS